MEDLVLGLRFCLYYSRIEPGLTRVGVTPMSAFIASSNVNGGANRFRLRHDEPSNGK